MCVCEKSRGRSNDIERFQVDAVVLVRLQPEAFDILLSVHFDGFSDGIDHFRAAALQLLPILCVIYLLFGRLLQIVLAYQLDAARLERIHALLQVLIVDLQFGHEVRQLLIRARRRDLFHLLIELFVLLYKLIQLDAPQVHLLVKGIQ